MKALRESQSKAVPAPARAWRQLTPEECERVRPLPAAEAPAWFAEFKEAFERDDGAPEDELAALRAENEALIADRVADQNAYVMPWKKQNQKLRAENERLKAELEFSLSENKRQFEAGSERNTEIAQLNRELEAIKAPAPEPPSGPSWLERVAAGPMRIGRPLP